MHRLCAILAAGVVARVLAAAGPIDSPGQIPARWEPPAISVKSLGQRRVASTEHVGPYWSIHRAFETVRAYMAQGGRTGPIFVRYEDDPTREHPDRLRFRVGFEVRRNDSVESSYRIDDWPEQFAAYMIVQDSLGTVVQSHRQVLDWIRENEYEPLGPIIEQYSLPPSNQRDQRPTVEVLVPVRLRQVEVMPTPSDVRAVELPKSASENDVSNRDSLRTRSSDGFPPGREIGDRPANDSIELHLEPPESAATDTILPAAPLPADVSQPVLAIQELMASGEFAGIAERLIQSIDRVGGPGGVFLQQFVQRSNALAAGIHQNLGADSDSIGELCKALSDRFDLVFGPAERRQLDSGQWVFKNIPTSQDTQKRLILLDMDRLLARVAMKSLSSREVLAVFGELLERLELTLYEGVTENKVSKP